MGLASLVCRNVDQRLTMEKAKGWGVINGRFWIYWWCYILAIGDIDDGG